MKIILQNGIMGLITKNGTIVQEEKIEKKVANAVKVLENGKAAEVDHTTHELLKYGCGLLMEEL